MRLAPSADQAEAAVAVIDDFQGQGLGTMLLALLAQTAREHGIRFFIAYVQPVNARVIRLARRAGAVFSHEDGMLRLEVPLEDSNAGIDAVLRAAAAAEIVVGPGFRNGDPPRHSRLPIPARCKQHGRFVSVPHGAGTSGPR